MLHIARQVPRNAALLVALLALIVVAPVLPVERSWFIVEVMFGLILIAGVHSVGAFRYRRAFLVLTGVTLAVRWGEQLADVRGMDVGALALTATWLFLSIAIIVNHLFRRTEVDFDSILGAIVIYLLAAVAFALVFQMNEALRPGAFSGLPEATIHDQPTMSNTMMYYSLVCITTMGYGDIVPVGTLARPLSVIEGVFGQLYLAVMIARLVGLHIANESARR